MTESICTLMLAPVSPGTEAEGRGVGLDVLIWDPPKPVLLMGLAPYGSTSAVGVLVLSSGWMPAPHVAKVGEEFHPPYVEKVLS